MWAKNVFFFVLTPALLVLALMLPTADWQDNSYNTLVFGSVYNYAHLRVHQQFENWYCAAASHCDVYRLVCDSGR